MPDKPTRRFVHGDRASDMKYTKAVTDSEGFVTEP